MKIRRAARRALAIPLMIGGSVLVLTMGTVSVFAASSSTPKTSSGPHEHEFVVCSPNPIDAGQPCTITFTDAIKKDEPFTPHKVCFNVNPNSAGTVSPCTHETQVGSNGIATGTFTSSANFCRNPHNNTAIVTAIEPKENNQKHHTTVTILCSFTTTGAVVPAGNSAPPAIAWLLGAIGLGAALVAGYVLRIRRWLAPRRRAAGQSE